MIGGLIAGIIGPQIVIWTRDALPGTPFAGSFYGQAVLALLALPLLACLRLPKAQSKVVAGEARPLMEIVKTPKFIVAAAAGVVSYGLMAFLMTAAPMAMVGCGHTIGEAVILEVQRDGKRYPVTIETAAATTAPVGPMFMPL